MNKNANVIKRVQDLLNNVAVPVKDGVDCLELLDVLYHRFNAENNSGDFYGNAFDELSYQLNGDFSEPPVALYFEDNKVFLAISKKSFEELFTPAESIYYGQLPRTIPACGFDLSVPHNHDFRLCHLCVMSPSSVAVGNLDCCDEE